MEIIYWLRGKFNKSLDVLQENVTEFKDSFKEGLSGKPRELTYIDAVKDQQKEFESLKNQGVISNWDEYKKLKEKQNSDKIA
jgi:hypothetical protein